jgi:hypothetical protein
VPLLGYRDPRDDPDPGRAFVRTVYWFSCGALAVAVLFLTACAYAAVSSDRVEGVAVAGMAVMALACLVLNVAALRRR